MLRGIEFDHGLPAGCFTNGGCVSVSQRARRGKLITPFIMPALCLISTSLKQRGVNTSMAGPGYAKASPGFPLQVRRSLGEGAHARP
jgi:hypothetical protein